MTAKELLESVRHEYGEVESLEQQKQQLRESIMSPRAQRADSVRVQTSPPLDPMGDTEGKIEEIEEMIEVKRSRLLHDRKIAEEYACRLDYPESVAIRKYYMSGKKRLPTLESVAEDMGYSVGGFKRIKRQAVRKIDEMMQNNESVT